MPKNVNTAPVIIRPSESIRSLNEFNQRVLMLLQTVGLLLEYGEITGPETLEPTLRRQYQAVKEFYNID
jgi:hypothetical protein